jgi:hypothetical protein
MITPETRQGLVQVRTRFDSASADHCWLLAAGFTTQARRARKLSEKTQGYRTYAKQYGDYQSTRLRGLHFRFWA